MATWVCYHVIGDALRGAPARRAGFSRRFAARLAAEPTVLAPQRARASRAGRLRLGGRGDGGGGHASSAGSPFGTLDPAPTAIAKAREAATVRAAQVRPQAVPADYLLAHQEYSPTTRSRASGPYLRARRPADRRRRAALSDP